MVASEPTASERIARTLSLHNEAAQVKAAAAYLQERRRRQSLEVQRREALLRSIEGVDALRADLFAARDDVASARAELDAIKAKIAEFAGDNEILNVSGSARRRKGMQAALDAALDRLESVEQAIVERDIEIEQCARTWWEVAEPSNELRLAARDTVGETIPTPDYGEPMPNRAQHMAIRAAAKQLLEIPIQ